VTATSPDSQQRQNQFTPPPELIAALLPTRAVASCAYGTVMTTSEAKAKGYDVQPGVQIAPPPSPAPGASGAPAPATAASAAPGASPEPGASPRPGGNRGGRFGQGNAFYYAPGIGLFVVRPPDLGTGGGSVKQ
jgi:hypothetical protein